MRGRKRQRKKILKKLGLWLDKGQRKRFVELLVETSSFHPQSRLVPMKAQP
jgi:hypothetical protein